MWRCRNREPGGAANQGEAGFTLIELMVVILIIAILMAIAIPTYLGARSRAENRAAQTTDRNALTAALANYASQNAFEVPAALSSRYPNYASYLHHEEPAITFGSCWPVQGTNATSMCNGPQYVLFSAPAQDGDCWSLLDIVAWNTPYYVFADTGTSRPGTYYGASKTSNSSSAGMTNSCNATMTPTSGWKTSFAAATP